MQTLAHDFLAESEALAALVAPLDAAAFEEATGFKGWTINDVLRHLHVWNQAAAMSLRDDGTFDAFLAELMAHISAGGRMRTYEAERLQELAGPALVAAWREDAAVTSALFAKADPAARVKWAGPNMSVRSSLTARLMETWAHGQEVYDLLGVVRKNEDRIGNIVVLGVNTYNWTFQVRSETAPAPKPYVRLTAPSGALWEYGEARDDERIEGPAEAFCQVVTQTRNIADTTLSVVGPNATAWMAKAQCFAGAAETPPAAGTRRTRSGPIGSGEDRLRGNA